MTGIGAPRLVVGGPKHGEIFATATPQLHALTGTGLEGVAYDPVEARVDGVTVRVWILADGLQRFSFAADLALEDAFRALSPALRRCVAADAPASGVAPTVIRDVEGTDL